MKDVSILKCVWKYITNGFFGISSYLLGFLNSAMDKVDVTKREQIAALLNIARKVLATIESLSWLCPTNKMATVVLRDCKSSAMCRRFAPRHENHGERIDGHSR